LSPSEKLNVTFPGIRSGEKEVVDGRMEGRQRGKEKGGTRGSLGSEEAARFKSNSQKMTSLDRT